MIRHATLYISVLTLVGCHLAMDKPTLRQKQSTTIVEKSKELIAKLELVDSSDGYSISQRVK